MNEIINGYRIVKDFSTQNAGMSRWGIAERDGEQLFIKEFLSPKYPADGALPPEILWKKRRDCERFYQDRKRFYDALAACKTGNNVITKDFFRFKTKYYITTEIVPAKKLTARQIAALPADVKMSLLKSILFSIRALHENGLVHSDLKLDNILLKPTSGGYYAAKIIDFDSGFLAADPPKGEDVVGDPVYFSPEAIRMILGDEVTLTAKIDIFALGIVFHQCWCGELPQFDGEFDSVSHAVLNDGVIRLADTIPPQVRNLIRRMLSKQPEQRPSAAEAFNLLCGKSETAAKPKEPEKPKGPEVIWMVPEL